MINTVGIHLRCTKDYCCFMKDTVAYVSNKQKKKTFTFLAFFPALNVLYQEYVCTEHAVS